ncbi:MAG: translation elongation factor Ts [Bacilli bacterium]
MITAAMVKELRDLTNAGLSDCKKALEATNGNKEEAINWLREKGIAKAAKKSDRIAAEGMAAILVKGNDAAIIEVNSETDFVAKNDTFKALVNEILEAIIKSDAKTLEEVLELKTSEGTVNDLIISKTATIGEKLSLRRFNKITKKDNETFGSYIHMGGKIAVLTVVSDVTEEVAKDISMHAAAMKPLYVTKEEVPAEEIEKERVVLKEQAMNEGKPAEIAEKMVEGRIRKYYEEICLEEQAFVKEPSMSVGKYASNNGGKIVSMTRFEVGEGIEKKEENFAEEVAKQING